MAIDIRDALLTPELSPKVSLRLTPLRQSCHRKPCRDWSLFPPRPHFAAWDQPRDKQSTSGNAAPDSLRRWSSGAWLSSCVIDFAVFVAGQERRRFLLSHAVALEGDAMGVVNDPVENGACDGRVCDQVMPSGHRDLGGAAKRSAKGPDRPNNAADANILLC